MTFTPKAPEEMLKLAGEATREIPLRHGLVALVDEADYASLAPYKWGVLGLTLVRKYVVRSQRGKTIFMHRAIMDPAPGFWVDHINGNPLDNRRANLRVCTPKENCRNRLRLKPNSCGFKGVDRSGKKSWKAVIGVDGRRICEYGFQSPEEAARAYDRMAMAHHGEFATLNFPARALLTNTGRAGS